MLIRLYSCKTAPLLLGVFALLAQRSAAQNSQGGKAKVDSLNKVFNTVFTVDLPKAEKLAAEALTLSVKSGYTFGEATARANQAAVLLKTEGHTKAIQAGFAALKLYDKNERYKNTFEYGNTLIVLAKSFHMEKDHIRNRAYAYQALGVAEKIKDRHLLALGHEHLGNYFSVVDKIDSAIYYYNKAKKEFTRTNYYTGLANIANNLGALYSDIKKHQEAITHFREAVAIYQQNNLTSSLTTGHFNIGFTYYSLKAYNKVLPYADSAQYYAIQAKRPNSLLNSYLLKAATYQALKNVDSCANYYEMAIAIKDSIRNDSYKKELAALQTQSDIYKKETENQLLVKDNRITQLHRNLALAGVLTLVVVLTFLLLNQRLRIQRRVKNKLEEEVVLRTREIFQQKETIFHTNLRLKLALNGATFDSQFAVNILNTIQEDVLKRPALETQVHLAKLSQLVQYVLEKSPLERVYLSEELQMAELYIQLEQLRLHNHFDYSLINNADEATTIPATLLQPFIENAILQGLTPAKGEKLHLAIEAKTQEGMLTISITDNGIDRSKEKLNKYNPRGSKIGHERLDLLTHLTHKNHLVMFEDLSANNSQGTRIVLQIPLEGKLVIQDLELMEENEQA
jgi:tetratricopeptide (TPR) repeat protein